MAWNDGINFGLFSDGAHWARWVLIALALLISVGVLWWVKREMPRRAGLIAAGLVVGGALGNVVDRLIYKAVADFANVTCCGIDNPYAFNIADRRDLPRSGGAGVPAGGGKRRDLGPAIG